MLFSLHIELTALLEYIDRHLKYKINVCCMGVNSCLPDNTRVIFLALCYIIAAVYSFICIELCIAIYQYA